MSQATPTTGKLTVVLVHGAYADGSSWDGVVEQLQTASIPVMAPANPLRGLAHDTAYTASYINQIPGPVLAVAHSYAGAVITNACVNTPNVVGLIFVDAFATDVGEAAGKVLSGSKDSILSTALSQLKYPVGNGAETATEFFVQPDKFHATFAADLPAEQAAALAATQRPAAEACFTETTTAAAWKTLPCWAVFGSADKAAGTDIVRSQAERAGATITEVDGSHLLLISQPQAVTDVIMAAIEAV